MFSKSFKGYMPDVLKFLVAKIASRAGKRIFLDMFDADNDCAFLSIY